MCCSFYLIIAIMNIKYQIIYYFYFLFNLHKEYSDNIIIIVMSSILNLTEEEINNFYDEVMNVKNNIVNTVTSQQKINHLERLILYSNILLGIAVLTIWKPFNIFSILSLGLYTMARWTIIGHHVCHGGYDNCNIKKYNKNVFGLGSLYHKFMDWFDWFSIKAWKFEHNKFHHYYLNETKDPDLVEDIFKKINNSPTKLLLNIFMWRWSYYASNTYAHFYNDKNNYKYNIKTYSIVNIFTLRKDIYINFLKSIIPYFSFMFIIVPLIYGIVFNSFYVSITVLTNILLAELYTNVHTFMIIVTNHAGSDLYKFNKTIYESIKTNRNKKIEFLLRAIYGSVNYTYGNELCDFLHGYLNYQIEHHMFHDLSALEYKLLAPHIKNICNKYKIQYIQESVFVRFIKTVKIALNYEKMKSVDKLLD